MGASIISSCNAPPVLDPAEHVFDMVPLLIERFVIVCRLLSLFARRDAGGSPFFLQSVAEPVGIVTTIGKQFSGFRQAVKQVPGTLIVAGIACREKEQQGPAQSVCHGVQLGVQAAFCSSDTAGKNPFFSKLAAVRWAFRWLDRSSACRAGRLYPLEPRKSG